MSNIYKNHQNNKATLCSNNNCVTVFGETAAIVNMLTIIASVVILVALIAKVSR